LIEARDKAEMATKAKQQFLSNMSHEIRTPLNAILGMTDLLLMENPDKEQEDLLQNIRFSGKNLLVLINDILDISKIEEGKIILENTRFNILRLLNNIDHAFQIRASEKKLEFHLKMDHGIPEELNGDQFRLSQVLNNLLENALKFTEKGKIELLVKNNGNKDKKVYLKFSVKDTGIGISEEEKARIFERFEQASSDTTRKYGGSGLGLTITRNLLELMNSEIRIDSEPGKGTEFYFDLVFPIAETDKAVLPMDEIPQEDIHQLNGGNHVLLVEDNELNMKVARKFLEKWNFVVELAENGDEALQKCAKSEFDLILMDLHMPVMDGWEATSKIRKLQQPYARTVPIIALTADVMIDDQKKFNAVGFSDYISKPFNPAELKKKIGKYSQFEIN
jgi:CheY-like chemotaxis protein/two-component sensor histidine kinase